MAVFFSFSTIDVYQDLSAPHKSAASFMQPVNGPGNAVAVHRVQYRDCYLLEWMLHLNHEKAAQDKIQMALHYEGIDRKA